MNPIEAPHNRAADSGTWPFFVTHRQPGIGAETSDIDLRKDVSNTAIVGVKPFRR